MEKKLPVSQNNHNALIIQLAKSYDSVLLQKMLSKFGYKE